IEHLKYIDVVISNKLPNQWQIILNGLKIVSIVIDKIDKEYSFKDISIDYQYKDYDSLFIGENHAICNNSNKEYYFRGIFELITLLEWDSNFFGYPVAFLSCKHLTENILYRTNGFIRKEKIRLVEYLCNCHDKRSVKLAEKNNYGFKDIRLTFVKLLEKNTVEVNLDSNMDFGLAEEQHIPKLREIGRDIYLYSRYSFDDNFNKSKVREFYMEWVEKAVLGKFDDECFALFINQEPIAFCAIKYFANTNARIGLVGVAENHTGKGVGKKLLQSVLDTLYKKGVKEVSVVTQGRNYGAQRLYQKVGFVTQSTELWYHKWVY
ncbi:MAG: GNAT family N-acetyltransferase, partial [Thermodesulfobacteriota bacterium]